MKYSDEILQLPLRLSTHVMDERVKILEAYRKSEEIRSFYLVFLYICSVLYSSDNIEQKCHAYITTVCNLHLDYQHLETFIVFSLTGYVDV